MSILGVPLGFLIWLTCVVLFLQFGLRFIISYKITPHAIEILLFDSILLKRILFENIARVQRVSCADMLFRYVAVRPPFTTRLGNRIVGKGVLIALKSGAIRHCIISPNQPDEFIRFVTANISKDLP
jgi:hypothetical protein